MEILTSSRQGLAVPDAAFPCCDNDLAAALAGFLEPPPTTGDLKFPAQGDEYFQTSVCPPFPFDGDGSYDWMTQDGLLPSPEEQDSDIMFLPPPPPPPVSYPPFSLPTPDSSSPSTPLSAHHNPEVLDALSLMDGGSPASSSAHLGHSHILPQFDTHSPIPSPTGSFNMYPYSVSPSHQQTTLLSSPLSVSPCSVSGADPTFSPPTTPGNAPHLKTEAIRDLLCFAHSEEEEKEDKVISAGEKAADALPAGAPKGKRRRLSKSAKKERKREQNKQAALRYRQRKRGEAEVVEEKREELEALNSDLRRQVKALSSEIGYLKNLWKEVETARARRSTDSLQ